MNDGVNKAAKYLVSEFKTIGLLPIGKSYSQPYKFNVNTFPSKISVIIDGKQLDAGVHYLIDPSSKKQKSGYQLFKTDSITYKAFDARKEAPLEIKLRKKLTYTVATSLEDIAVVELLKDSFPNELKNIDIIYENKFIQNFKCQNVCGYIKGTQQPDSFLVYSAQYDH